MSLLEVSNLKKVYVTRGGNKVEALSGVNFLVEEGEYVAIMGESGSGKTTLLNILAAIDKPTSGKIFLEGKDISSMKEAKMALFRREKLGFVFQDFNLLDCDCRVCGYIFVLYQFLSDSQTKEGIWALQYTGTGKNSHCLHIVLGTCSCVFSYHGNRIICRYFIFQAGAAGAFAGHWRRSVL